MKICMTRKTILSRGVIESETHPSYETYETRERRKFRDETSGEVSPEASGLTWIL